MLTPRRKLARLLRRFLGPTALVLIYHRVAELERDPQLLAVTPERFDAQMAILAKNYRVVTIAELTGALARGVLPDKTIAITFDDGYADNLTAATPILEARGLPATVYVSSGLVESGREFWWDELERWVLSPGTLPEQLRIDVPAGRYTAHLRELATYPEDAARRDAAWNVASSESNVRQRVFRELNAFMRPLSVTDRESALAQLRAAATPPASEASVIARPSHRPLTPAEVARLDGSAGIEVGSHTRDHAVLSGCSPEEQRRQIELDRNVLSQMCGRPMRTFSYPYGSLDDYTDETVQIVRDLGFEDACSNHAGTIRRGTDPWRLPRLVVRDWDDATFAENLEEWFSGSL